MKKYLIALLLSLSCACAVAAVGCGGDSPATDESSQSPMESVQDSCTVSFENGEGFSYASDVKDGDVLTGGSTLSFQIDLGGFYLDSVPVVYANDSTIVPDANGTYSVRVTQDTVIRVEGVKRDVSNMTGTGAFDDAFLVTKPIDLLFIAEQVNAGVARYVKGAYILANDIDCKGEELKVIGDLSTDKSYFAGCFTCETDPTTEEATYHTVSNFTINSQNTNYVGLFGAVQADANVTSSGLFYGIRLDNFSVNAGLTDIAGAAKTLAVGSLVGYGAGANILLCNATNGHISVAGENNYFSYAGGLIGFQQAYYNSGNDQFFSSEIAYSEADVDIDVVSGLTLYAGGISGYLCTNYPLVSVSTVHNSIARGNVTGALRTGGIVGGLGQYSTVCNSYAVNDVMAMGILNAADGIASSDEYYYATAGGIVGYAENDTIVSDCFHNGDIDGYAVSGDDYVLLGDIVGGGQDAYYLSPLAEKYVVWDCMKDIDLNELNSTGGILNEELGWEAYDWIFVKGSYPEINLETPEGTISRSITLSYVTFDKNGNSQPVEVNGKTSLKRNYLDTSSADSSSYVTMGSFFAGGGLAMDYTADNGLFSYGYFLDPECTLAVPYSYMPTKDITLYIAFYDLSEIANTYYFRTANGNTVELSFGKDGVLTYTDGARTGKTVYYYNGERLSVPELRLARYYDGEIFIDEYDTTLYADPNFDLYRYTYYSFAGNFTENGLTLFDGYYFTEDEPFVASLTLPETETFDVFKGVWTKSANVRKTYTFDGKGNWTYSDGSRGTYTLIEEGAALTFTQDGVSYTASFNGDGFLQIAGNGKTQIFGREAGYLGTWRGLNSAYGSFTLSLGGIDRSGSGNAKITYENSLTYTLSYEASETDGYVALFIVENGEVGDIFGYFRYQNTDHTLQAVLDNPYDYTAYSAYTLYATDDYSGEWICNADDLKRLEFDFNGIGLSAATGEKGILTITEDGVQTKVSYTLNSELVGSFRYKDVTYEISYNEDEKSVTVSYADKSAVLERKDVLANKTLIDTQGNTFVFDGRSNLTGGGKFVMNDETQYGYQVAEEGYIVLDGGNPVGSIVVRDSHYEMTIGGVQYSLYIQHELSGEWAMRGMFDTFSILHQDTEGYVYALFKGHEVKMRYVDGNVLSFSYYEGKMPYTYYVVVLFDQVMEETCLILTEYADLSGDDYVYCTRASDLFGTWTWGKDSKMTLRFDGVSDSYAEHYSGVAKQSRDGYDTAYYYTVQRGRIMLQSQDALQGQIWYYDVRILSEGDEGYEEAKADNRNWFGENGTVLVRTKVDSLYLSVATDEDENEYFFDFLIQGDKILGAIRKNGEIKYTYVMEDVTYNNTTRTATLTVEDVTDGKLYQAILDYSNESGDVFILGDALTE